MVFSSTLFCFIFLPLVVLLHTFLPRRNWWILLTSLVFYFWGEPGWGFVLLALTISFNYGAAVWLEELQGSLRRWVFVGAILVDLASLFVHKYANFAFTDVLQLPLHISIGLPLGISFFTFQVISYLADVYYGTTSAERKFLNFAVYIAMFPHLIAGPIVRFQEIREQIDRPNTRVKPELVASGIERFIRGLAKKVLIADILAKPVDAIYALPAEQLTTPMGWLGAVLFSLQVYYDFSGYSDMAIGIAKIFGFHFPENFLQPFHSKSIREFWRRWHITLSFWIRDYVYIPLAKCTAGWGRISVAFSVLVSFIACGLWHGAAWPFVFWGIYQGIFVAVERLYGARTIERLPVLGQRLYFLIVAIIGFGIFRCQNLAAAGVQLRAMFGLNTATPPGLESVSLDAFHLFIAAVALWMALPKPQLEWRIHSILRPCLHAVLFLLTLSQVLNQTHSAFIYFRF